MQRQFPAPFLLFISMPILISLACLTAQPVPTDSAEPTATATETAAPTATPTPRPSPTLRPTQTPDLAATQHIADLNAEVKAFYDKGYLAKTEGQFIEVGDFSYDWAQLGWYKPLLLKTSASDFFMSAHFKWHSAIKSADISGCGFLFDVQPNTDHYAVFLDQSKVFFLITDHAHGFSKPMSPTRGNGRVKFDYPAEADFTLIVKDAYAYVLVNNQVVGEYTLAQSRSMHGELGLTVLSGTNRDYGTHCEMTKLHLWIPEE